MAPSVKKDARGIKLKLEMLLGDKIETYDQLLSYWFRKKCSNNEFKSAISKILSPEMVYYHNQYLLAILDHAFEHITPSKDQGVERNCNIDYPLHKSNSNKECKIKTFEGKSKNMESYEFDVGRCYDCEICDKSYKYKWNLSRHVVKIHNSEEKKASQAYCDICQEVFLGRDIKEKHFQSVHMPLIRNYWASKKALNFTYECESCKKRFLHKKSLVLHMETHTEAALPSSICL